MKALFIIALVTFALSGYARTETGHHDVHAGDHDHEHGPGCGHTAEMHDGHIDYEHDGHHHHIHGSHVHECTGPHAGGSAAQGYQSDAHHTAHADHTHVHGFGCGHDATLHEDHVDYQHDGHTHHYHGGHWHECQ